MIFDNNGYISDNFYVGNVYLYLTRTMMESAMSPNLITNDTLDLGVTVNLTPGATLSYTDRVVK